MGNGRNRMPVARILAGTLAVATSALAWLIFLADAHQRQDVGRLVQGLYPTGALFALGGLSLLLGVLLLVQHRRNSVRAADAATAGNLLLADRLLFKEFLELLPSDGPEMRFVRDHTFGLSYDGDADRNLRHFFHEWDVAERMFHNAELERLRRDLHQRTRAYLAHLGTHSFPHAGPDRYRIYPDFDLDFESEKNAFAIEAARKADALATDVWRAHQALVAEARRRLGV